MTQQNIRLDIDLFEDLSDADLVAVTGGNGGSSVTGGDGSSIVGVLLNGVADANQGIGNGGTPTTGALDLIANTLTGAGTYTSKVANGAELGLQAVNATVSRTTGKLSDV